MGWFRRSSRSPAKRRDRRQHRRERHDQTVERALTLVATLRPERILWSVVAAEVPHGLVVRVVLDGLTIPPPSLLVLVPDGGDARLLDPADAESLGVPPWR